MSSDRTKSGLPITMFPRKALQGMIHGPIEEIKVDKNTIGFDEDPHLKDFILERYNVLKKKHGEQAAHCYLAGARETYGLLEAQSETLSLR